MLTAAQKQKSRKIWSSIEAFDPVDSNDFGETIVNQKPHKKSSLNISQQPTTTDKNLTDLSFSVSLKNLKLNIDLIPNKIAKSFLKPSTVTTRKKRSPPEIESESHNTESKEGAKSEAFG